ncbi:hypothetical protein SAM23877_0365 [Streptomyces ambofaciens ATCC 23877]|uniref:Uncharacterized protein n=1 Tax=Streptomyces ambofaciens (strain ATCC 23877 / 3486 / DSM 40053 / JCM 4204 / NBRC 12836 / NRRL B-2516) TaxID=278992 RepID=A0A0K2AK92_STRA7|nr:hypothetical protein SAM23877_0365 [Streptomyces ambofaciens ATCC 23877]
MRPRTGRGTEGFCAAGRIGTRRGGHTDWVRMASRRSEAPRGGVTTRRGTEPHLRTGERPDRDTGQRSIGMDSCRGDEFCDGSCDPSPYLKGMPARLCQRQNNGRTGLDDHYSPAHDDDDYDAYGRVPGRRSDDDRAPRASCRCRPPARRAARTGGHGAQ